VVFFLFKKWMVTYFFLLNCRHKLPKAGVNISPRVTISDLIFFGNSICVMILIKCLAYNLRNPRPWRQERKPAERMTLPWSSRTA